MSVDFQWTTKRYIPKDITVHILRMPTGRIPRELFDYHPEERRERGRPLKRWRDQFNQPWDLNGPEGPFLVNDDDDDDDKAESILNVT
jgi:hypothetical protein